MKAYLYKITNKINNKCYVGQTIQALSRRMTCHFNLGTNNKCPFIFNAIKKYGKSNFETEIIKEFVFENNSVTRGEIKRVLNLLENALIKYYNCLFPNGYNAIYTDIDSGLVEICQKTRNIMSKNMKRINNTPQRQIINFLAGKTNKDKKRKGSSSPFIGVNRHGKSYTSIYFENYKTVSLGSFKDEISAAITYDYYIVDNNKNSKLNFPENIEKYKKNEIERPIKNKSRRNLSSEYLGVGFSKQRNNWKCRIPLGNGKEKVKFFKTEIEAAKHYDQKVIELKLNLKLNFEQVC